MALRATIQIGKNGPTEGTLNILTSAFKNHKQVRISVLKSYSRDRYKIQQLSEDLRKSLKFNTSSRIIGFTIILSKIGKTKSL